MVALKSNKPLRFLFAGIAAVVLVGVGLFALWDAGGFLPSWVSWEEREIACDLDLDGAEETVFLAGKAFSVVEGDSSCESDAEWLVQDVAVGDIDRDGAPELVSLVWKQGSFGEHRPFWVENDSPDFSQHVFIHRYAEGALQPVWMSSALGIEVRSMSLDERMRLHLVAPDGSATTWAWESWGLTLVEEADPSGGSDSSGTLSLIAVGDNIAHEGVYEHAWVPKRQEYDFTPLYARVKERISSYDVAVVNQETILVADPALRGGFPLFATPVAMGDALADSGFDVVLGATNHALDRGQAGIDDTLAFWRDTHPEVVLMGLHESADDAAAIDFVEANGIRLALFNATEGLNGRVPEAGFEYEVDVLDDLDGLVKRVQAAETRADATVCFLHIGEEYASEPTARQREVVEQLVDAGADAVICSHPHVIQPMEELRTQAGNTGVVYWSLGNFISNQMDPRTVLGAAASLRFERQSDGGVQLAQHEAIPLVCHFDQEGTWACFLDDYTEEDAAAHYLNKDETAFTLESLRKQWHAAIG